MVKRRADLGVQCKCRECEEEEEEAAAAAMAPSHAPRDLGTEALALKGEGQPLPTPERAFFEARFNHDFRRVRVHTGPSAARLARDAGAEAFTLGPDIFFSPGRFAPRTAEGRRLLAHELAHTIQQERGSEPAQEQEPRPRAARRCCASEDSEPEEVLASLGAGKPLDSAVRARMERGFGASFAHVRVHLDAAAEHQCVRLQSAAFAVGSHIAFRPRLYRPGSLRGDALIAHELAHVLQQSHSGSPNLRAESGQEDEVEADANRSALGVMLSLYDRTRRRLAGLLPQLLPRLRGSIRLSLASCGGGGADRTTGGPTPAAPTSATPSCEDICRRANADASLNGGGGGVVCDGATKCPCVFDLPVIGVTRGECAEYDRIALIHERRHLTDVDCNPTGGLHRPPFRDPSQATASECAHRRETITLLDGSIPGQSEPCRTRMTALRGLLAPWVAANCGTP
jgi:hypothetical protein